MCSEVHQNGVQHKFVLVPFNVSMNRRGLRGSKQERVVLLSRVSQPIKVYGSTSIVTFLFCVSLLTLFASFTPPPLFSLSLSLSLSLSSLSLSISLSLSLPTVHLFPLFPLSLSLFPLLSLSLSLSLSLFPLLPPSITLSSTWAENSVFLPSFTMSSVDTLTHRQELADL